MGESKKILVAFDPKKPEKSCSDFLVPILNDSGEVEFLGTHSKKKVSYEMVVLTDRVVSVNDLVVKLVDAGQKIPNVGDTLSMISTYLEAIPTAKIGNIVEVVLDGDELTLKVVAKSHYSFGK